MISRRLSASLVVLPLAVSLAACGSSESGSGSKSAPSTASSATAATSTAPSTATSASPSTGDSSGAASDGGADAVQLVARMKSAVGNVTSLKFETETSLAGTSITGSGVQKLSKGKLVAFDIQQKLPTGEQRIIIVGGKTYLEQPGVSTEAGKPYVLVSASSSNPLIRQLATSLQSAQSTASVNAAVGFLAAAKSVKNEGSATVAGQKTTHYKLVVDPTKLPTSSPNSAAIKKAGLTTLPIDVYLDGQGRPVETVTNFTVQGKKISSKFVISQYNGSVTVQAPPASQVSTK